MGEMKSQPQQGSFGLSAALKVLKRGPVGYSFICPISSDLEPKSRFETLWPLMVIVMLQDEYGWFTAILFEQTHLFDLLAKSNKQQN